MTGLEKSVFVAFMLIVIFLTNGQAYNVSLPMTDVAAHTRDGNGGQHLEVANGWTICFEEAWGRKNMNTLGFVNQWRCFCLLIGTPVFVFYKVANIIIDAFVVIVLKIKGCRRWDLGCGSYRALGPAPRPNVYWQSPCWKFLPELEVRRDYVCVDNDAKTSIKFKYFMGIFSNKKKEMMGHELSFSGGQELSNSCFSLSKMQNLTSYLSNCGGPLDRYPMFLFKTLASVEVFRGLQTRAKEREISGYEFEVSGTLGNDVSGARHQFLLFGKILIKDKKSKAENTHEIRFRSKGWRSAVRGPKYISTEGEWYSPPL